MRRCLCFLKVQVTTFANYKARSGLKSEMKATDLQRAWLGTTEKYLKNKPQGTNKSKNLWIFLGPRLRQTCWDQAHPTREEKWLISQALDNTERKTQRFQCTLKNRSISQVWNSRGPQMPLLLTSLSIYHLWSYNYNFTCIDQSSPLWTKKTQVCIYSDFLKKKNSNKNSVCYSSFRTGSPVPLGSQSWI